MITIIIPLYNKAPHIVKAIQSVAAQTYKRCDAKKATEFATKMLELGDSSWRTRLSANWLGFWVWWLLKQLA